MFSKSVRVEGEWFSVYRDGADSMGRRQFSVFDEGGVCCAFTLWGDAVEIENYDGAGPARVGLMIAALGRVIDNEGWMS